MRMAIVEDEPIVRSMLWIICAAQLGHEVAGEAESGRQAVDVVLAQRPDLVLLDLALPDITGLEVVERVRRERPEQRWLVITAHVNDVTIYRAEQAGVRGFLWKCDARPERLREAIDAVGAGRTWYCPVSRAVRDARLADPGAFSKILSPREQWMLALIGRGLSDAEIAAEHGLSPATAQKHRSNLLRKLGVAGSAKLTAYAIEHGFARFGPVRPGPWLGPTAAPSSRRFG